jgi:5-methylcytosine-specific restriction protein A
MASLSGLLATGLDDYAKATSGPFAGNRTARLFRDDLPDEVRRNIADPYYLVKGSAGNGRWAETPWVSIFDPLVTTTAQRGHYVVYLFRGDGQGVYLSLNQGTTEIYNRVKGEYLAVLETNARAFTRRLPSDQLDRMHLGRIQLFGDGTLTRGYASGNIAAIYYDYSNLPDDPTLAHDLAEVLRLYSLTVEANDDLQPTESESTNQDDVPIGIDAAKYRWHLRAERNRTLSKNAKRIHGYTCAVCGFNFEQRYGEIGQRFIEAHHLTPFSSLKGRPTELDPRSDFTVVCSNCHRMLHRTQPPLEPASLRERLTPVDTR